MEGRIRGILFDLDGTLLDIDLSQFLDRYFAALTATVAKIVAPDQVDRAMRGVGEATEAMLRPHPGRTNQEAFRDEYLLRTGIDIDTHADIFARFYETRFAELGDGARPRPGAIESWSTAEALGLRIAVATNPIFPLRAIEHRLSWAGIDPSRAHVITSYERMHACKPSREYYRETAELLDCDPRDCIMVGDDLILDMAASDVGMVTFYAGHGASPHATYNGSLAGLPNLLQRLCGSFGEDLY